MFFAQTYSIPGMFSSGERRGKIIRSGHGDFFAYSDDSENIKRSCITMTVQLSRTNTTSDGSEGRRDTGDR
jgi:hypothetical protein